MRKRCFCAAEDKGEDTGAVYETLPLCIDAYMCRSINVDGRYDRIPAEKKGGNRFRLTNYVN